VCRRPARGADAGGPLAVPVSPGAAPRPPISRRPGVATLVWLLVSLVAFKLLVLDAISLSDPTPRWWLVFFPCLLLGLTLMALNFLGDALRDYFDPKRQKT